MNKHTSQIHQWNTADTITSIRIAAALFLLFLPLHSVRFLVTYTLIGLTDVLDGWVARKTGTASTFGAKLDSTADLVFFGVLLLRLFPMVWQTFPVSVRYAICGIVLIRLSAYGVAAVKYHRFVSLHTLLNKLTGAGVFLLPYVLVYTSGITYSQILCILALAAAFEELLIHLCRKEYHPDQKSIFQTKL